MITANAKLRIERIPLDRIQVKEYQNRYVETLLTYIRLLTDHTGEYAGLLFVTPSDTHAGMYVLLDGHHKFCASIMTGRQDALCVVIEEPVARAKAREQQNCLSGVKSCMRRFVLRNVVEGKSWEGVLFSNGCVALNIAPEAYQTHFHSWREFSQALIQEDVHVVEWLDT